MRRWLGNAVTATLLLLISVWQTHSQIWDPEQDFNRANINKSNYLSDADFHDLRRGGNKLVSNFVNTLINSEKYLKNIDNVEQKVTLLDGLIHERTENILRYLTEVLKLLNTEPVQTKEMFKHLKKILHEIQVQLHELEQPERKGDFPARTGSPVDGEFQTDPVLDTRLTNLETQIKSIMAGVDSIVTIISEVKARQGSRTPPSKLMTTSQGGESTSMISEFRKMIHDTRKKCECKSGRVDRSERYPTDCHEIQMQGFNVSGIYKIKPEDMEPFYVLCDLITAGGGWTVIQNRFDGSQDFYKGWSDYKNGFGNLAGEFWLGLEKLNYLTNQKLYELRVEIETQHGQEAYAGYSVFTVGPEYEGYRISTLGTYYGSAGDSLSYHAGQKFSTIDADNDEWKVGQCAVEHGGAWWYKECDKSNLNGKYSTSADEHRGQSIYWISFKGPNFPLTKTKMMIRPLPASRPNDLADPTRKLPDGSSLTSASQLLAGPYKSPHKLVPSPHQMYHFDSGPNNAFFP